MLLGGKHEEQNWSAHPGAWPVRTIPRPAAAQHLLSPLHSPCRTSSSTPRKPAWTRQNWRYLPPPPTAGASQAARPWQGGSRHHLGPLPTPRRAGGGGPGLGGVGGVGTAAFPWKLTLTLLCPHPQRAVEVMCIVPKRCNDMMNVGRLQGFDVMHCPSLPCPSGFHRSRVGLFTTRVGAGPVGLVSCLLSLHFRLIDIFLHSFWEHLICFWGPSSAQSPAHHGGNRQDCSVAAAWSGVSLRQEGASRGVPMHHPELGPRVPS